MKPAGQGFLAVVLLLAVSLPAAAAQAKTPGKRAAAIPLKNPMVFYLAQGDPNSCGPGCDQWIAAEGAIAHGTAERMRAFLKRQGSKAGKLPIYFNSPGGITTESLAMGRLMRERGITGRVARTIPQVCEVRRQRVRQRQALRSAAGSPADQSLLAMQFGLRLCHRRRAPARDRPRGASRHPRGQDGGHRLPAEGHTHTRATARAVQGAESAVDQALSGRHGHPACLARRCRQNPARIHPRTQPRGDGAVQYRYPQRGGERLDLRREPQRSRDHLQIDRHDRGRRSGIPQDDAAGELPWQRPAHGGLCARSRPEGKVVCSVEVRRRPAGVQAGAAGRAREQQQCQQAL